MTENWQKLLAQMERVREMEVAGTGELDDLLRKEREPFVVRGLVADWPLVAAGRQSSDAARRYLLERHRERPVTYSLGKPGGGGRLFYDEAMQVDFTTQRGRLAEIFELAAKTENDPQAGPVYLASIDVHDYFSDLHDHNHVDLGDRQLMSSIWMGTRSRVAAHNDFPENLACVAVGRRRFTLFPPDQFRNLYLGPLDNTPAGRPISMVDFHDPDWHSHPRFRHALEAALTVELEPGDALYVPTMWWHHVEAFSPFNAMINYWWRDGGRWRDQPQNALFMAILTIRDLPPEERRYWRELFDHYVFENKPEVCEHLPEEARGILASLTSASADRLRTFLLRQLSR